MLKTIGYKMRNSWLTTLVAMLLVISTLAVSATAASDLSTTVGVEGLTVGDSGSTAWSASAGGASWSGTTDVKTGCNASTTVQSGKLELQNSGDKRVLSFEYEVTLNGGTLTIDGENKTSNGSFSKTLDSGEKITIDVSSNGTEAKTTTVEIKNINLGAEDITVTFKPATNGSYTVDGVPITVDTVKKAPSTTSYALVATPAQDYTFIGWYLGDAKVYESATVSAASFATTGTLTAKFVPTYTLDPLYMIASSTGSYTKDQLVSINSHFIHSDESSYNQALKTSSDTICYYSVTDPDKVANMCGTQYVPWLQWKVSGSEISIAASGKATGEYESNARSWAFANMLSDVIQIYAKEDCVISFDYTNTCSGGKDEDGQKGNNPAVHVYESALNTETLSTIWSYGKVYRDTSGTVEVALSKGKYLYIYSNGFTQAAELKLFSSGGCTLNYSYSASISNFVVSYNEQKYTQTSTFQDNTGKTLSGGTLVLNGVAYSVNAEGRPLNSAGQMADLTFPQGQAMKLSLAAAPTNYRLLGWNVNGSMVYTPTYEYTLTENITVNPVFVPNQVTYNVADGTYTYLDTTGAVQAVNGHHIARTVSGSLVFYSSLEEAFAQQNEVVLLGNMTINGDYEIPAGKTLIVPSAMIDGVAKDSQGGYIPTLSTAGWTAYAYLTVNNNLTVNGNLLVSGSQYDPSGAGAGPSGVLLLNGNMSVNGGLYSYGLIKGNGTITANTGAQVHELCEVVGIAHPMVLKGMTDAADSKATMPFNFFYVNSIEAKTVYNQGATLDGHMSVQFEATSQTSIRIIGSDNCLFVLSNGSITKFFDYSTAQITVQVDNDSTMQSGHFTFTIEATFAGINYPGKVQSEKYYMPLASGWKLNVLGNLVVDQRYKVLPGATVNVGSTGTMTIAESGSMVFYRLNDYDYRVNAANNTQGQGFSTVGYPVNVSRYVNHNLSNIGSAKLNVDGKVIVNGGLYVTDQLIPEKTVTDSTLTYQNYTHYANGYNYLTGSGVIDTTAATNSETSINENLTNHQTRDTEWTTVKIVPIKGLKADASANTAENYESLSGMMRGITNSNGLNVWSSHPCASGHTEGTPVNENAKDPTCTAAGSYDRVIYCTVCKEKLSRQTMTMDANGHNYTTVVTAPNCTEQGYTTHTCSACGDSYKDTYADALGHTDAVDETVAPTCTETGLTEGSHCSVCNAVLVVQTEIPALGHSYGEGTVTTAPTCEAEGVKTFTCATCGGTKTETIAALGHSYGEGTVTTAPTCEAEGVRTFTCATCGGTKTETIEATGHSYGDPVVIAPTCTEAGTSTKTCGTCGETDTTTTPATGHNEVDDAAVDPTCTAPGKTAGKHCSVCGTVMVAQTEVAATGHSYDSVVTAPACEAGGYTTHTCANCGDSYTDSATEATGHSLIQVEAQAPTCSEAGYEAYEYCTKCDYTTYKEVAAKGHTEVIDEAVAPDCDSTGLTEGKHCSVCNTVITAQQTVPALGHTEETIPGKEATCTATGLTEGVKCSVCGEILTEQTEIPVKDHEYESVVTDPTCEDQGYTTHTCSACGDSYVDSYVDALDHDYEVTDSKAATCTEDGYITYTCKHEGTHTYTEAVEAPGHTLTQVEAKTPTCSEAGYEAYEYCSECDYTTYKEVTAKGHTEETIPGKEATCTETGLTEGVKCSVCGEIITAQETIPTLGHTEETIPGKEATCTETGLTEGVKCSVCDNVLTEQTEIPVKDHEYESVVTDPTCKDQGYTTHTCSACSDSYVDSYVDALDHDYEVTDSKAATCTEDGYITYTCKHDGTHTYTETVEAPGHTLTQVGAKDATCTEKGHEAYEYCSKCDYTTYKEVAAKGHTEVIDEAVAPDCDSTGLTEGKHCSVCNTVITAQQTVPALGHTEETIPGKEATCTETGLTEGVKCSVCGEILTEQTEISVKDHEYESVVTDPACEDQGYTTHSCSACGDSYVDSYVDALDHDYEVTDSKAATCTEDGYITYTCKHDGTHTYTETVEAPGHTLTQVEAKTPTCSEAGYEAYEYCSECDYTTYKEVAAKGHTEETIPGKEATCTATGLTEGKKCSVCGEIITAQETIPTLGHTEGKVQVENEVAADCENSGSYDNVVKCSICGEELSRKTVAIPALGHTEAVDAAVAPTCTTTGLTEGKHCSVCDAVLVAQNIVPAKGHTVAGHSCSVCHEVLSYCGDMTVEYGGDSIVINIRTATALKPTSFVKHMTVQGMMDKVDFCANSVGNLETLFNNAEFRNYMAELLQISVEELPERLAQIINEYGVTEAEIKGNAAVIYVAYLASQETEEAVLAFLTSGNADDTAADHMSQDSTYGYGLMQRALAYGMYNAYAYASGDQELIDRTDSLIQTLEHVNDPEFIEFIKSEQGRQDLKGLLEALKLENVVREYPNALETILAKGFNDTDFVGILEDQIANYRHDCAICGETVTEHLWIPATHEAPMTCSLCNATFGTPLVSVEAEDVKVDLPEDSGITKDEAEQATESMKDAVVQVVQPTDSGLNSEGNKDKVEEAKDKIKDEKGNPVDKDKVEHYSTVLTIKLQNVSVGKDAQGAAEVKKFTYDVTPYLYAMDANGQVLGQTELNDFDQEIIFRLPVPQNTEATKVKVWHNGEPMGYYEIITDEAGNKYVEVRSTNFSPFEGELHEEHPYEEEVTKAPTCTEAGEKTYTCECGETKTEIIPATGHKDTTPVTAQITGTETHATTVTCSCGYVVSVSEAATCADEDRNGSCDVCNGEVAPAGNAVNIDVLANNLAKGPLVTLLSGTVAGDNWEYEGSVLAGKTVDFAVSFNRACVVIVATTDEKGNVTYAKQTAIPTDDMNTYKFSIDVVDGMEIIVAVKGDVDMNGSVNVLDVIAVRKYILTDPAKHQDMTALQIQIAKVTTILPNQIIVLDATDLQKSILTDPTKHIDLKW